MPRKSKKRRASWASITEVERGRKYRIRYWAQTPSGYRRVSETVRGTLMDAERRRAELMLDHSEDAPKPTVGECWRKWYLPDAERRVADGELAKQSLGRYRSLWEHHIAPAWDSTPVDAVRPLSVQQWLLTLSRSSAQGCVPVMRQVMEYAVRYEHIPTNPMSVKYVMPAKSTSKTLDDGAWSPDELVEVWRACVGTPLEAVVLLCGFGSLRLGEALGIRPADVDRGEVGGVTVAYVTVDSQIDASGTEVGTVKNRWSYRTAVLAGIPAERLCEIAAASDEFVAEDERGGAMNQDYARRAFDALIADAGVERHTPRALRRSWQTMARWTLRLPPWITERMMGHVGEGVTGRSYDRPDAEVISEAVAEAWRERGFVHEVPL